MVLYRKWRSRSFGEMVGQEHVVRTLRNAIAGGKVGHAYLFTGPRGTGKTSSARILAKAVNCLSPVDGDACNRCEMCVASEEGRAIDVIEIDAASNTSVDSVRDLRERVTYAAGEGRYKVYIVDEVHRLSPQAFDAFLKTLEEPPPHVIFVFASTEPHKIPATISSRCQRFDFRRFGFDEMYQHLQSVILEEGLDVSDDALHLIVHAGNGSMRDALGILEQVAAYGGAGTTDADQVRSVLGLADPELVARLSEALLARDPGAGLRELHGFVDRGGDPGQINRQLIDYWRAMLLAVAGAGGEKLVEPALAASLPEHASRLSAEQVLGVLHALSEPVFSPRFNVPLQLPLEAAFVQACLQLSPSPPRPPSEQPPAEIAAQPEAQEVAETAPPAEPTAAAIAAQTDAVGRTVAETRPSGRLGTVWPEVLAAVRKRSLSSEAMLRSGHVVDEGDAQATIGFLYDFHAQRFADVERRRLVEESIAEVTGTNYRISCTKISKSDVEAINGSSGELEDDGFLQEAAERLRRYHLRELPREA
ncbi:MAG: DNA polymerase III subunit gamma/tau [Chloroflexota bacterium]